MRKHIEDYIANHFNKVIMYLVIAGALMIQDFMEGHHSYGMCVFALAILDVMGGE